MKSVQIIKKSIEIELVKVFMFCEINQFESNWWNHSLISADHASPLGSTLTDDLLHQDGVLCGAGRTGSSFVDGFHAHLDLPQSGQACDGVLGLLCQLGIGYDPFIRCNSQSSSANNYCHVSRSK